MRITIRSSIGFVLMVGSMVHAGGCATVPEFPGSLDVAVSAAATLTGERNTGPAVLASSTWSLTRRADPNDPEDKGDTGLAGTYGGIFSGDGLERPPVGERIFLVRFGPGGEMVEVTENRFFLADIYGDTVPVGGEWADSSLPGVSYRSASYGVQIGDRFGIAVIVHVRFLETFLGQAILYAWGTVADDTIDGQFGYVLDFTDGAVSFLGTVADQYPIDGQRVGEE